MKTKQDKRLEGRACNSMRKVHISSDNKAKMGMVYEDMAVDKQGIVYQSDGRNLTISHLNPMVFNAIPKEHFKRVISVEVPWDILSHKHYSVRGSNGRFSCREEIRAAKIDHKIHGEMYVGTNGILYKQSNDDGVCEPISKRSSLRQKITAGGDAF